MSKLELVRLGLEPIDGGGGGFISNILVETWGENTTDDHTGVTDDTRLAESAPTTNNNGQNLGVKQDAGFSHKSVLRFNLALLAGKTIHAAILELFIQSAQPLLDRMDVRVENDSWVETTATWNTINGSTAWTGTHGQGAVLHTLDALAASAYMSIPLTAEVDAKKGLNLNLILLGNLTSANFMGIEHSEGVDGQRPRLIVAFE